MVEAGADFLDVYRFYLEEGEPPRSSYQQAHRVFRGGLPSGCGPFTKDLGYSRGLILLLDFFECASRAGQPKQAELLFCGKTCVSELPNLAQLIDEGIIRKPEFVPPPFAEQAVLELWASVSRAVTRSLQSLDGVESENTPRGGQDLDSTEMLSMLP